MKYAYIVWVSLCLLTQSVFAEPVEEILKKDISFLLWEEINTALWVKSGEAWVPLENLSPYRRSAELAYEGVPDLVLYEKSVSPPPEDGDGEGEPVFVPVGRVRIPPELKKPLVILVPGAGEPSALRGWAFEDHPTDFPMGTYKLFNMTRRELAVGLDQDVFTLRPGGSRIVDPNKGRNTVLEFQLMYRNEAGEAVTAQKTVFRYRMRRREILFIKEDPKFPDRFETHMVMEYLPMPTVSE